MVVTDSDKFFEKKRADGTALLDLGAATQHYSYIVPALSRCTFSAPKGPLYVTAAYQASQSEYRVFWRLRGLNANDSMTAMKRHIDSPAVAMMAAWPALKNKPTSTIGIAVSSPAKK